MKTRRLTIALGVVAVGVGLTSIVMRSAFGFQLSYVFVTLIGVLALVQGLRYASARRSTPVEETETGTPEHRYEVPVPGDDFDDAVVRAQGWTVRGVSQRRTVRDRLHEVAVSVLVAHRGLARDEAEKQIARGTWTDDPYAAGFLSESKVEIPLTVRIRGLFRRESQFARELRETVAAIEAVEEDR